MKLKCDEPLSNFAFNFNWRRYIELRRDHDSGDPNAIQVGCAG